MIELLFLDHVHKQVACHPKIFAGSVGEKEGMIGRALVLPDAPAALGTLSTALAPLPAEIAVATCSLQLPSYRDGSAFIFEKKQVFESASLITGASELICTIRTYTQAAASSRQPRRTKICGQGVGPDGPGLETEVFPTPGYHCPTVAGHHGGRDGGLF